jgi:hypothetical protein
MSEDAWVVLSLPEAQKCAELHGIRADIFGALQYAKFERENSTNISPMSAQLVEPLVISIVIKYCRAFAHGVRRKGDLKTEKLPENLLRAHNFLKAFRDMHVAHSVNAFEGNIARGRFNRNDPKAGINFIACSHAKLTGFTKEQLDSVIELCQFWIEYIDQVILSEEKNLLELLRRIPVEDLLKSEPRPVKPIQQVSASKPRKRIAS